MTTTLRPTGTEEYDAEGARSRSYDICVNSRPVGIIRLDTDTAFTPPGGRITQLAVEERERRRGRGTVAALAAEEVLRGWGCAQVTARIPARSPGALRLAESLGYLERSRTECKDLTGIPTELPAGNVVRPMTEGEFGPWRDRDRELLLHNLIAHGVPREQAVPLADAAHPQWLPNGLATRGAALRVLEVHGDPVGSYALTPAFAPHEGADAWVYALEVNEPVRGRGHGRTLLSAAEAEARAAGARLLGLTRYPDNEPARRLTTSLGYRTAEQLRYKHLL